MSLDQQTRPNNPSPEPPAKPNRLDLSITKVMGGALAAMTAAALGSRLSVAGTIVGAALASVVAAVATAIYTASLKHTQDKVRTVFSGRTAEGDVPTTVEVLGGEAETPTVTSAPVRAGVPQWDEPVGPPARPADRRVNWKSMIIGALAAFGIAAVALTGIELVTGHALSGGDGTTITQVSEPRSGPTQKKPAASASPRESASDEPSASASASTEPEPSASTSEPTDPEPSASATEPTPSSTPSSSTTPSTAPSGAESGPAGVR